MLHYEGMNTKQVNGMVMHALGALGLLGAVVFSLVGAVSVFTAPSSFWTTATQEKLVSTYLAGSLMIGLFGVLMIAGGLLMARPRRLARPVYIMGVVYCVIWLAETVFLWSTGHSWISNGTDALTLVVCFIPGVAALVESRALGRARAS